MSKRDLSCDNFVFLGEIVDVYNKMSPDNFVYIFVRIVANDNGLIMISSYFSKKSITSLSCIFDD